MLYRSPDRPRLLSTRAHLTLLGLLLLLPVLAFAGAVLTHFAATERTRLEQDALHIARSIALAVDRDLAGLQAALQTLSRSRPLLTRDFEAFDRQAREVRGILNADIVLRDLSGQQIVNTRLPWGSALPRFPLEIDPQAIATGRPVISDVFTGAVAKEPVFAIAVPALQEGEAAYVLSLSIPTGRMLPVISQALPRGWVAGLVDRKNVIVSRSVGHEAITGQPAVPGFVENATGAEGNWTGIGRDGQPVLYGYARSQLSGWMGVATIPQSAIEAPLRRSLQALALLGGLALALSVALAAWFGRRFTEPVRALASRAAALGRGEAVAPVPTTVREMAQVGEALSTASTALHERERERERAEARLRESEAEFRLMADQLPEIVWRATPDGENDYLNRRWHEFTGEPGGAVGRGSWIPYLHPDDVEPSAAAWRKALATGEPFEAEYRFREARTGQYRWQLGRAVPVRDQAGRITHWLGTCTDIDDQKQAELLRRETEERQAFLLALSDRLRGLSNPQDIMVAAAEMLGCQLRANRVGYGEVDEGQDAITAERDWTDGTVPSVTGRFSLTGFGPALVAEARAGRTVQVDDVRAEPRIGDLVGAYEAIGVGAFVSVPLVKEGRLRAVLSVHHGWARVWSDANVALAEEAAERTWAALEQARAEATLREETRTLETLNRTGAALAAELDLERLVQRVTDAGVELTGAQFGAFFYNVLNQAGESFMLYTLSGVDRSAFEGFGMPRATAVFRPTFKGEGVIRSDDILADPRYGKSDPHRGMPKGHLPVRSYLAVPVASRSGEVLGGLFFGHPEPGRFHERHERLMVGIAAQAAIAIDNARLYQDAQRELEKRRQAEEQLRASEDRLRLATEAAAVGTWDFNPVTGELRWDVRTKELFGLPPTAEIDYGTFLAGLHPEDRAATDAAVQRALAPNGSGEYDIEYRTVGLKDGVERWIAAKGRALFETDEASRHPVRFVGTVVDITEPKRAEEALLHANALLGAVMEAVPGVVYAKDRDGRMLAANRGTAELVGKPLAAIVGRTDLEFLDDMAQAEVVMANDRRIMAQERAEVIEEAVSGPDGGRLVWLSTKAPFRDASGAVIGLVGASVDITDRKRAEERLRELNETLEARVAERTAERDRIWRLSQDLLGVADAEGRWLSINPAWEAVLGWSETEIVGRTSEWLEHPDDQERTRAEVAHLAAGGRTLAFENRFRHCDGSYRWLSWTAVPEESLLYCVARDVTAEKERQAELEAAQEALRQSQKMEAVGQLTGGIAHDFNNMLAVVIGSLDLLGRRLGAGDARARRYVDAATDGARRAALLTQRLLAFSRQQPLRPEPIDANKLVAGMSDLLRHSLGTDVRLETVLAGGLWRTHADPNQLENVILNLAVNARDAMSESGKLTIETANAHLDARYAAAHLGVPAGQYVLIAVTDSGSGMPPEVIAKAFDPFFTTKEVGKGTGLGLSQVYGFVKQSGGHVKIYSEPGQGTIVKVYLPRYTAIGGEVSEETANAEVPLGESQEVVLVVEDEPAVRQFSVDALAELGYPVLEADGAAAALRLLDLHPEIVLLFTDVVMPDVNGRKLADEARRRRPDLKVMFTTGYTRNAVVHNGVLDPGVELIGKPFTIEELAAKVRDVLDAPATVASG